MSTDGPDYYGDTVPIYITLSVLSIIATSLVTLVSISSARVRGDHYSIMVQTITVCDLLFTLKFLVSAVAWASGRTDARSSFQLFHDNCMSAAAFGIFTGLACISWNAAWIFDFLCVLINPLRNTAAQRRWYHVFVWSLCIFGTVWTLATSAGNTADNHTCLVRGTDNSSLIFEIPLIAYMILAIGSLIFAAFRLSAGTRTTAILRRRLLARHAAYVLAFAGLWVWPLIHDFLDKNGTNYSFAMLDAISVSSQAAIFAIIRLSEPGAYAILQRLLRFYTREFIYFLGPLCCCCLQYTRYGRKLGLIKGSGRHSHHHNNRNLSSNGNNDNNNNQTNTSDNSSQHHHDDDENQLLGYSSNNDNPNNIPISSKSSFFSGLGSVRLDLGSQSTLTGREIRSGSELALLPNGQVSNNTSLFSSLGAIRDTISSPKSPGGGLASPSDYNLTNINTTQLTPSTWLTKLQTIFGSSPTKNNNGTTLQEPLLYNTSSNESNIDSSTATPVKLHYQDTYNHQSVSVTIAEHSNSEPTKLKINPVKSESSLPSNSRPDTIDSSSDSSDSENDDNEGNVGDEDGWDLTAGLRTEMGVAMLSGLCQSIASVDRIHLAKQQQINNGLSSDISNHEGFSTSLPTMSPTSSVSNDSYVSVGPSAPEGFRSINQWLRDSTTVTRIVPVSPPEGSFPIPSSVTEVLQAEEEERLRHGLNAKKPITVTKRAGSSDHVEVISFAEEQFHQLRYATGITPEIVIDAFHPELLVQGMLSAHFSDGASSSFFCRSNDSSMIVKTVNSSEIEVMLRLLPAYMRHLSSNPDSLLARVYGCFSIRVPSSDQMEMISNGKVIKEATIIHNHQQQTLENLGFSPLRIYFILMGNVFPIIEPGPSALIFDLKGSTVNRRARVAKASGPPARHQRHFQHHPSSHSTNNSNNNANTSQQQQHSSTNSTNMSGTLSTSHSNHDMSTIIVSKDVPTLPSSSSVSSIPSNPSNNPLVSPSVSSTNGSSTASTTTDPVTPPVPPGPKMRLLYQDVEFREAIPHGLPVVDSAVMVKEDTARAPVDEKGQPLPHASFIITPEMMQQLPGNAMNIFPDIRSGGVRARALVDQLQRDVTLLASQGLMDYSMLIQLIPVSAAEEDDWNNDEDNEDIHHNDEHEHDISDHHDSSSTPVHESVLSPIELDDIDDDGSILSIHGARAIGPRYADRLLRILDSRQQKGNMFIPDTTSAASSNNTSTNNNTRLSSSISSLALQRNISANSVTNSLPLNPISRWSSLSAHVCALGTPKPPPIPYVSDNGSPTVIAPPPYSRRVMVQVGIIDLFQFFNTTKKMELALKSIRHGSLEPDISAVDPHRYAIRFMAFVANVFTPLQG